MGNQELAVSGGESRTAEGVISDEPKPNSTPTGYIFHGRSTKVTMGPMSFIINVLCCGSSGLEISSSDCCFSVS